MPKLPGSGIRLASIPLAQAPTPFSPEADSSPLPDPAPRGGQTAGGASMAGIVGLLLLVLGLGRGTLTTPADTVPQAVVSATSASAQEVLEVPPFMRAFAPR